MLDFNLDDADGAVPMKDKVRLKIETALDTLRLRSKQWQRLQQMTEEKLYSILEGGLDLYYFLQERESYLQAFKEMCHFKWTKKTKVTLLIMKSIFGEDVKQVHAYAKALEEAVYQKVGRPGEIKLIPWLRAHGGVSGVSRNKQEAGAAGNISKSAREEAERKYTIDVGREAEKYGARTKGVFTSDHILKAMNEDGKSEAILLCEADYQNGQLKAQWISYDEDLIERFYVEKGQKVMKLDSFKKYQMEQYAQRKAEEIEASAVVAEKIAEFAERFPFTVETADVEQRQFA